MLGSFHIHGGASGGRRPNTAGSRRSRLTRLPILAKPIDSPGDDSFEGRVMLARTIGRTSATGRRPPDRTEAKTRVAARAAGWSAGMRPDTSR